MQEVAQAAGVSKAALFHYFASKRGFYSFLYEFACQQIEQQMQEGTEDFFECLLLHSQRKLQVMRTWQGLYDFLSELAQEKNAPLRAQLESGHKQPMLLAQKLLFKNVNWGKLKPQLTPATALHMVGYLSTGLIQEKAHQPPEQILEQLSQMFSLLRLAFIGRNIYERNCSFTPDL